MNSPTYFSSSVIRKKNKLITLINLLLRAFKNNPWFFFFIFNLAVFSAIINFNAGGIWQDLTTNIIALNSEDKTRKFKDSIFPIRFRGIGFSYKGESKYSSFLLFWFSVLLVKSLISSFNYFFIEYCWRSFEADLKKDLLNLFFNADYPISSKLIRKLQNFLSSDIDEMAEGIWRLPSRFIGIAVSITLYVVWDFVIKEKESDNNGWIILILCILFSIVFFIFFYLFFKANNAFIQQRDQNADDNKKIFERVDNIEHIKISSSEEIEKERIKIILDKSFKKKKNFIFFSVSYIAIPDWFIRANIPLFLTLSILFLNSINAIQSSSSLLVLVNLIGVVYNSSKLSAELGKLLSIFDELDTFISASLVVSAGASLLIKKRNKLETKNYPLKMGDVLFNNVCFAYPGTNITILDKFNFTFKKGKIYGIFGENGIGKSTITKTLIKLYDLNTGEIFIEKINLSQIDTKSLRKNVCYQTNRPVLFSMTIAENVYYPNRCPPNYQEKLSEIAKKVGIDKFINKLPKGLDTVLISNVSGSIGLSEGQKQQIGAMKIFLNNYNFYILDEILSNVSPDLRKNILKEIFAHIKSKEENITIVIDHHYGIFRHVDEIYDFCKGSLVKKTKDDIKEASSKINA